MLSVACRDYSLYLTTQGGLAFSGDFYPTTQVLKEPGQSPSEIIVWGTTIPRETGVEGIAVLTEI